MGNREDLLAGAKRCLYEKGYARTTARDIAAASGVSLAAIGYHFGSMEALLNAALIEAIGDWGDEIGRVLAAEGGVPFDPAADPIERFAAIWTRVIESFATHRQLLVASFEFFTQLDRAPDVRRALAEAFQQGRLGLAELFQGIDSTKDEHTAWMVGSFYQALMTGLIAQWLAEPDRVPSGHNLADALRIIISRTEQAAQPSKGDDAADMDE